MKQLNKHHQKYWHVCLKPGSSPYCDYYRLEDIIEWKELSEARTLSDHQLLC